MDRLDRYLERLDAQIQADEQVPRAVEVAVKVAERRAKLLGIDVPERIEASIVEAMQEDVALAELVREAHTRLRWPSDNYDGGQNHELPAVDRVGSAVPGSEFPGDALNGAPRSARLVVCRVPHSRDLDHCWDCRGDGRLSGTHHPRLAATGRHV